MALAIAALVGALALVGLPSAQAVHDLGLFELDKNATNDLTATKIGVLDGNVSASATSITICQSAPASQTGSTVLIDGEQILLGLSSPGAGGGCAGTKLAYSVTRAQNSTTAAGHSKGEDVTRLVSSVKPGDDWSDVYAQITADANDEGNDDKCVALGAAECAWTHDPVNTTVFTTGGSKDDLDVPSWRYTDQSVPDADEILDAFAAKYIVEGGARDGHQVLYFGADRLAVNGAKDFGFWFFRNPVGLNADGTFSGQHSGTQALPGDILILGTFTQGGAATNIRVFRWVGTGGNATANGTVQGPDADFGDCVQDPPLTNDNGCGTVNNTTVPSPWPYLAKGEAQGMQIPSGGLLEGGIDLTAIGLDGCFSSFVAETRSAPSVDAQLKDFVLGNFEACGSSVTTTPADGSGTALTDSDSDDLPDTQIGTGSDGVDVTDTATVDVTGISTWGGTVAFHICGPLASGTCDSGGVAAGTKNVSNSTPTATSDAVNLTEVGRYCWRGVFAPDAASAAAGLAGDTDSSTGECFEVLPVTPTLSTTAWSSGDDTGSAQTTPVDFGNPVYDRADLSGTAHQPGTDGTNTTYPSINATMDTPANGSIVFTLVGPDTTTTVCDTESPASGTGTNPETVTVSGDGDYYTAGFTPAAPGDYHWVASYSGDSPNTLSADHNTDCTEAGEDVTVRQIPTQIKTQQSWFPNDTATITSSDSGDTLGAGGTVDFSLYGTSDCTGTALYTEQETLTGGSNSEEVGTSNTTFEITTAYADAADSTAGPYSWKVVYTPASGDTAHTGIQSACDAEHFSITYTNDNGPGTDLPEAGGSARPQRSGSRRKPGP